MKTSEVLEDREFWQRLRRMQRELVMKELKKEMAAVERRLLKELGKLEEEKAKLEEEKKKEARKRRLRLLIYLLLILLIIGLVAYCVYKK
jgi:uncharacterized membrane protein (DUF106 family)